MSLLERLGALMLGKSRIERTISNTSIATQVIDQAIMAQQEAQIRARARHLESASREFLYINGLLRHVND